MFSILTMIGLGALPQSTVTLPQSTLVLPAAYDGPYFVIFYRSRKDKLEGIPSFGCPTVVAALKVGRCKWYDLDDPKDYAAADKKNWLPFLPWTPYKEPVVLIEDDRGNVLGPIRSMPKTDSELRKLLNLK